MFDMMDEMMRPFFQMRAETFSGDVREGEEGFTVTADLPGVKKENINVDLQGDTLTLNADFGTEEKKENNGFTHIERRSGKMSRSFNVKGIDKEAITAKYENGVLVLNLPKMKKEMPETRKIMIEGTEGAA